MAKLRLGVIGAGAWAMAQHLPAFAAHSDEVEPLIVNRRDPEMLRILLASSRARGRFDPGKHDLATVEVAP